MWGGLLGASVWEMVLFTLLTCHLILMSVTLYLHRTMAHRAVDMKPGLAHAFRAILWLGTGMRTVEWVAIHRKHHARCETVEDPHSPVIFGLKEVFFRGAELYGHESRNAETIEKFGHGCPEDWIERHVYTPYPSIGILLLLFVEIALFGVMGLSIWAVQMICIPLLAAGVINGIGHHWGYRNYESDDASTNVVPWAFVVCGEELHNNHHAYPSSAKFSIRPWEFDMGWMYLRLFAAMGLVKVRRVAPQPVIDHSKHLVDLDTVKAIVVSRLHVMEYYASKVIKPAHKMALANAKSDAQRQAIKLARGPMIKVEKFLDEAGQKRLLEGLEQSDQLKTVYEYRAKLQDIWQMANASHERLVQALQDWCVQAENSGIDSLQEFATRLRGYSLKPTIAVA
ncbi:MAG: DesA family fatty acid desaturase [Granulosicoccaceae bacterium]